MAVKLIEVERPVAEQPAEAGRPATTASPGGAIPPSPPSEGTRYGPDLGLGALLIGLFLLILYPVGLILSAFGGEVGEGGGAIAFLASTVAVYLFLGLAILGLLFALAALMFSYLRREPKGLPICGIAVSVPAVVLWVFVLLTQGFANE